VADVVALHAEESLIDFGLAVAGDRDDLAVLDADLDVAAGAAETTGSFVPLHTGKDR
jgi:hypothetical protein